MLNPIEKFKVAILHLEREWNHWYVKMLGGKRLKQEVHSKKSKMKRNGTTILSENIIISSDIYFLYWNGIHIFITPSIFIWEWKTHDRKFKMGSPFPITIPILRVYTPLQKKCNTWFRTSHDAIMGSKDFSGIFFASELGAKFTPLPIHSSK